jgi:hypothetical protein
MKKCISSILLLFATYAFGIDMQKQNSIDYKENWTKIGENFYIDTSSIVKNKMNLSSAVFKTENRERAKIVGVAYYEYTAYGIDVDCTKKELVIKFVFDKTKPNELIEVKGNGIGVWTPIESLAKNNRMLKAYERLCH